MEANWTPLENRLGWIRCGGFMRMGRVNGINLYKHGISRSYLNLDDDGNCYIAAGPGCYSPVDFELELAKLEQVFEGFAHYFGKSIRRELHRPKAKSAATTRNLFTDDSS
jgi:hypothetical protein